MENTKLAKGFYTKKGNVDWKVATVGVKIDDAIKELQSMKQYANENGFLDMDICISKDGQKIYPSWNLYHAQKEQVTSAQHSPDRDSVPF